MSSSAGFQTGSILAGSETLLDTFFLKQRLNSYQEKSSDLNKPDLLEDTVYPYASQGVSSCCLSCLGLASHKTEEPLHGI